MKNDGRKTERSRGWVQDRAASAIKVLWASQHFGPWAACCSWRLTGVGAFHRPMMQSPRGGRRHGSDGEDAKGRRNGGNGDDRSDGGRPQECNDAGSDV